MISFQSQARFNKDITVVVLSEETAKDKKFSFKHKLLEEQLKRLYQGDQFSGEEGQVFPLVLDKDVFLLVGIGKSDGNLTSLRTYLRRALLSSFLKKAKSLEVIVHQDKEAVVKAVIEAILIGTYSWDKYKSKKSEPVRNKNITIVAQPKKVYEETIKICEGATLTRDLINENADVTSSVFLEKVIRGLIKGKKNISIEVLGQKEMEKKGLGLHLAVNKASPKPPRLIIVKYSGGRKGEGYTALIGKGMTYDTGGLNIKPTGSMETMKCDMSGAGAIIGTLKNALALNVKKNVLFVCAIAENVTDANSYKPGDVIIGYSGKTVEVGNTDAEGRLVLADAFSYVIKNYKPKEIIDIATLTGACVVALAHDYTGLVTTDDNFAREIIRASNETDDRAWRLPIYPELKDAVKSQVADIRNLGFPKGAGGTITAAEFLRQFTQGTRWAHLDIAGTSFVDGMARWYYGHGATGAGVRLLTYYLQNA